MKKIILTLLIGGILTSAFAARITQSRINKWINECHREFLKRMEGVTKNSPESIEKKKSIEQDYREWYEGYRALKKGENVSMWTFRTDAARGRLAGIGACPKTAAHLPEKIVK